jgi:hypothetical protein
MVTSGWLAGMRLNQLFHGLLDYPFLRQFDRDLDHVFLLHWHGDINELLHLDVGRGGLVGFLVRNYAKIIQFLGGLPNFQPDFLKFTKKTQLSEPCQS